MSDPTSPKEELPLPIGTEIEKVNSQPLDAHKDGAIGRVLNRVGPLTIPGFSSRYGYLILWDDFLVPVFTMSEKVQPKESKESKEK